VRDQEQGAGRVGHGGAAQARYQGAAAGGQFQ
jgi:hypothetical protein